MTTQAEAGPEQETPRKPRNRNKTVAKANGSADPAATVEEDKVPKLPKGRKLPERMALPDGDPPENVGKLAGEYVGLSIAGGIAAGLLIGLVLPRLPFGRLFRRGGTLATLATEVGVGIVTAAIARSEGAMREGGAKLAEVGGEIGHSTAKTAAQAAAKAMDVANDTGDLAHRAGDLAGAALHQAADHSSALVRAGSAALVKKATGLLSKVRG